MPSWGLWGCRCRSKCVRFMDRIQEVHFLERKTSERTHVVQAAACKDSSSCHIGGQKSGLARQKQLTKKRRSKNGLWKNQSSMTLWDCEAFVSSTRKMDNTRTPSKTQRKVGSTDGSSVPEDEEASQQAAGNRERQQRSSNSQKTEHACIVEAHESTRKRSESTLPKNHEDHIAQRGFNSLSHSN